jgi:hypothetical protein
MQNPAELKKFSLEDKKTFDKAYSKLEFPLAEHSFSWLYIWDGSDTDTAWTEINGNLCLFCTFEGSRNVWGPVLPGNKLKETLKICFEICEEYNSEKGFKEKPKVTYIPEELKEKYENVGGYVLKEQNQDYIYNCINIIELKGDKYKSKRNLRNYFLKNYESKVEDYDKEVHFNDCLELLKRWEKRKLESIGNGDEDRLDYEVYANKKILELVNKLNVDGIVVYVDGKIEGYTFGEKTNERLFTVFFEKTNLDVKGLSVYVYSEFLKRMDCKVVNAGEDWGVEYLKKIKMSYHPSQIRKSYMLQKK